MFRKLIKNKKAQNTAEYALLISLVVAGIIAMQTYAQRALQARVRDASIFLQTETTGIGNTTQYEPYYLTTNYDITRVTGEVEQLGINQVSMASDTARNRDIGGFQSFAYNMQGNGI